MSELSNTQSITGGPYCQRIWSSERRPVWVIGVDISMSALSSAIHNTGHLPRPTETRACRPLAPDLQATGTALQFLCLASLELTTPDARAVTKDSAYRSQRTCAESAAEVLSLAFCPIAVWR